MLRPVTLIGLFLITSLGLAHPSFYQVDMIVFMHPEGSSNELENLQSVITHKTDMAIPLQEGALEEAVTPYRILSPKTSALTSEYSALAHQPAFQLLFHYTWLQPSNNQQAVLIPIRTVGGYKVEGTLRIRQGAYYLLDTELVFSEPNHEKVAFVFSQQQRLKPGTVYYLDHPKAGMLIKIHHVS